MRIVLAVGLFAIGVELPKAYMARHAKGLSAMVIPTMGIGWIIVAGMYSLSAQNSKFTPLLRSPPSPVSSIRPYIMLGYLSLLDSYGSNYLLRYRW